MGHHHRPDCAQAVLKIFPGLGDVWSEFPFSVLAVGDWKFLPGVIQHIEKSASPGLIFWNEEQIREIVGCVAQGARFEVYGVVVDGGSGERRWGV